MNPPSTRPLLVARVLACCFDLRTVLALLALLYAVGYAFHLAVPGGNPAYPLGWWGWTDQGHYLSSAKALAHLDFAPAKHFYPPLYAALGALFIPWSDLHSFWMVDLACLLWFAAVFVMLADAYTGRVAAVLLLLGSVVANYAIFECFLIPWTSTITAALVSTAIYALLRLRRRAAARPINARLMPPAEVFAFSLLNGLMILARPLDAVVGGVLWLGLVWIILRSGRQSGLPGRLRWWRLPALAALGFCAGPTVFLGYNQLVFGTPAGAYFHAAAANGYFPADLAEKFVSIFLDSQTLYLEPAAGMIDHYPWLVLALVAILRLAWRGDWLLRLIAGAVCVQFALYLPYGDLLPNGLWRYMNIHYFKWVFPYLALFAWLLVVELAQTWRRDLKRALVATIAVVLAAGALLSLRLELAPQGDSIRVEAGSGAASSRSVTVAAARSVDLIDITGWGGGFEEVYFGNHQVRVDGKPMLAIRDFRLLPAPWGIRLLFLRPQRGAVIEFEPDPRLRRAGSAEMRASMSTYRFVLRSPPRLLDSEVSAPYSYRLGELIDFSSRGNGDWYVRSGWSHTEPWGRWSDAGNAKLRLRLALPTVRPLTLRLRVRAFMVQQHPRQLVEVFAGGSLIGKLDFRLENGAAENRDVELTLPAGLLERDGELRLDFRLPDAIAPERIGYGGDPRTLGLGLVEMSIVAAAAEASK